MREFVVTTESNSDLPWEYLKDNEIGIIPHYYTVEDEVYGEDKTLSIEAFYQAMREGKRAGTMASNPAVILEKFSAYAGEGKDILHVSFSSGLSGGYSNVVCGAQEVMEEYPECRIIVIDTLSGSMGEGLLIRRAVQLKREGKSIEEAAEALKELVPHLCVQFTVDNLDYLYRGGRLSKTSALLGTMVNIKPVLYINEEGKLVPLSKVRGRKKSLSVLVDNMKERIGSYRDKQDVVAIVHGDCLEDAQYLQGKIQEELGLEEFLIVPIGPSIGAHSGPGTIGIIFYGDHK